MVVYLGPRPRRPCPRLVSCRPYQDSGGRMNDQRLRGLGCLWANHQLQVRRGLAIRFVMSQGLELLVLLVTDVNGESAHIIQYSPKTHICAIGTNVGGSGTIDGQEAGDWHPERLLHRERCCPADTNPHVQRSWAGPLERIRAVSPERRLSAGLRRSAIFIVARWILDALSRLKASSPASGRVRRGGVAGRRSPAFDRPAI